MLPQGKTLSTIIDNHLECGAQTEWSWLSVLSYDFSGQIARVAVVV